VTGSAQNQSSQTLGVPEAHVQSNVQDVGIEMGKVNRQRLDMEDQAGDEVLSVGALASEHAGAAECAALVQGLPVGESAAGAEAGPHTTQAVSTSAEFSQRRCDNLHRLNHQPRTARMCCWRVQRAPATT
jgi:hypothetical protein